MTGPSPIRAVTFDFWNTLYSDPEGVSAERTRRRAELIAEAARDAGGAPAPPADELKQRIIELLPMATRLRDEASHGHTTEERVAWVLSELGVSLRPDLLGALARAAAELGVRFPPAPVDGAREVVAAVAASAKAGVVSDTGIISGRCLTRIMASDGLAEQFGALGFSDETGRSKPHAKAFLPVLERLGVGPEEAVHVGDLAETDVAGALALGMRAVWIDGGQPGSGAALSGIARPDDPRLVRVRALGEVPAALRELQGRAPVQGAAPKGLEGPPRFP
ncbi:MAG: HAD family hydrolase [Planctomycetota bacterium]|jgi:putative hydrolase of the HAD superfamily